MNESIQKLDKAAQNYAGRVVGNDEDANQVEWFNVYKEKFAELIVRECVRKVEDMIDNGWYADTEELKKHFGVEE